jgi:apolipoprotein D and lipocalin family protein
MKLAKIFSTLLLTIALSTGSVQAADAVQAIPKLDVSRYLGRWYEIAKFPNQFQKKCVSDTSAEYSLLANGQISVLNQCRLADGALQIAEGLARQIGGPQSAKLEVRFAPAWLSFLPFVWGNYWVIDLDERYELAAVSEPNREYLWILSRTPVVDEASYKALLHRLASVGLDVQKLEKSKLSGSASIFQTSKNQRVQP